MEKGKKKYFSGWKTLSREQEEMIVSLHAKRKMIRSEIMRKYGIPSDQYCYLIRCTGVKI